MHVIADGTIYWWVLYLKYKFDMYQNSRDEDIYHWVDLPFWGKEIIILKNFFKCIFCHKSFSLKQKNSHIYKFTMWKDFLILFFAFHILNITKFD
jgi:hypothetical protein